jgi:hypothetical protein
MMSKWGSPHVYLLLASTSLVAGCNQAPASTPARSTTSAATAPAAADRFAPAAIAAAKAAISAEPSVKDLLFEEGGPVEWQVGVLSDGSPRFGFAEYLCQVARNNGVSDRQTEVRVVDIGKVANGVDFTAASLGTVQCSDGTRLDDAPAARG